MNGVNMIPKTFEELFDQIEIDANNEVVFNKAMYLNQAKEIASKANDSNRPCLRCIYIGTCSVTNGYGCFVQKD
jgi:hypothetical protein